jgi:hypothetical protein
MNDVQHFEAARALAERMLAASGPTTVEERITFLYRTVLARSPVKEELKLASDAYRAQHELFAADPQSAKRAVGVGDSAPRGVAPAEETAAWTMIANLVLNLDETVMRN